MKSRLATLLCLLTLAACGTDTPKEAGAPGGLGVPDLPGPIGPTGSSALGLADLRHACAIISWASSRLANHGCTRHPAST